MVRTPLCNYNTETTVLAHWRDSSTGIGQKENDLTGSWCCSACHDVLDGRNKVNSYDYEQVRTWHLEGIIRTQQELLRAGIIKY